MGEAAILAKPNPSRPPLVVPASIPGEESFLKGKPHQNGEFELYTDRKPFSQLLAGAFGSPMFSPLDTRRESSTSINQLGGAQNDGSHTSNYTAKYRAMMPSRLPIPSSNPYFTVPPGLSPTTFLESPVLFSGGLADPSPTTGSFPVLRTNNDENHSNDRLKDIRSDQNDNGFIFRPHPMVVKNEVVLGHFGASYHETLESADDRTPSQLLSQPNLKPEPRLHSEINPMLNEPSVKVPTSHPSSVTNHTFSYRENPTSDGYNWKKYGQKQLKGSEFPRSYYKCTHPNCPVKKQVECSNEGEITEIMYKGDHNHPKPQSTRRTARNGSHSLDRTFQENAADVSNATGRIDSDRISVEVSSSSLVISHTGVTGTPEHSFCSPSDDDNEATKMDNKDDEDEQDSKRRRTEEGMVANAPIRTIREPRVVVKTVSEVDILDDGYRWRKYGQKIVKGNFYPRSYYKCTNVGCVVRKHLERSSSDPKSVITTYEGKHNHNVPAARGGGGGGGGGREANLCASSSSSSSMATPPCSTHAIAGSDVYCRPSVVVIENDSVNVIEEDDRLRKPVVNRVDYNNYNTSNSSGIASGATLPMNIMGSHFSGTGLFRNGELGQIPGLGYHNTPFSRRT